MGGEGVCLLLALAPFLPYLPAPSHRCPPSPSLPCSLLSLRTPLALLQPPVLLPWATPSWLFLTLSPFVWCWKLSPCGVSGPFPSTRQAAGTQLLPVGGQETPALPGDTSTATRPAPSSPAASELCWASPSDRRPGRESSGSQRDTARVKAKTPLSPPPVPPLPPAPPAHCHPAGRWVAGR